MTHIVLAVDGRYLPYVPSVLGQVGRHGSSCEGVVLVVPSGLDGSPLRELERLGAALGLPVHVVEAPQLGDLVPAAAIRASDHVSAFTFSKLLLPTVLPAFDQVLYLDVDLVVRDSIEDLLSWDLRHPLGAVHEIGDGAVHLFGSTRTAYFNAGVLRMSLDRMRELDVLGSARAILRERPDLPFHDQDVLNLIFRGAHDVLPLAFNMFEPVAARRLPAWQVLADPAIVHFVGPDKPWLDGYASTFTREWRSAQRAALSRSPELARRYARADAADGRRALVDVVIGARRSAVGRRLRAALPVSAKARARASVLWALPPRTRLARSVRAAMLADVDEQPASSPR